MSDATLCGMIMRDWTKFLLKKKSIRCMRFNAAPACSSAKGRELVKVMQPCVVWSVWSDATLCGMIMRDWTKFLLKKKSIRCMRFNAAAACLFACDLLLHLQSMNRIDTPLQICCKRSFHGRSMKDHRLKSEGGAYFSTMMVRMMGSEMVKKGCERIRSYDLPAQWDETDWKMDRKTDCRDPLHWATPTQWQW